MFACVCMYMSELNLLSTYLEMVETLVEWYIEMLPISV